MSQFGAEYDALMAEALNPPPPTLAEQKANALVSSKQSKEANIQPKPLPTYEDLYGEPTDTGFMDAATGESNLIDAMQASLYKTAQGIAKVPFSLASSLAEFSGADEELVEAIEKPVDWATDEGIDKFFGYDPTPTQEKIQAVEEAYEEGDVLGTAGAALAATPGVLAESAGSLAAMFGGGVGLLGKSAQTAQKGAKVLTKEADKIKDLAKFNIATTKAGTGYRMETLKDSLKARKALSAKIVAKKDTAKTLNTLDNLIRINKGTVALGISDANQQLDEYKANNNGESAGFIRAVTSGVVNTALYGLEFNILKGIGKGALKDVIPDISANTIKAALTGNTKTLAKAIGENTLKVVGAAGAEAGQEYAQAWTQILTEKAGTAKYGDVADVLGAKEHQTEAAVGAILGAAAGGGLRAAPIAVTAPVKVATKTVEKVATKTAEFAAEKATEASYGILSVDERAQLKEQFDTEDARIAESTKAREAQIDKIGKTTTIEELRALGDSKVNDAIDDTIEKSKTLSKIIETVDNVTGADTLDAVAKASAYGKVLVEKLSTADKANPETIEAVKEKVLTHMKSRISKNEATLLKPKLESIKNAAIAQHNKDIKIEKAAGVFTKGKDVSEKVVRKAFEKAKAKGQELVDAIPQEAVDKVIELVKEGKELTKDTVETVVSTVKDVDKSVARALLDDLVSEKPRRATLTALTKLNIETLNALEKAVKSNPKASRIVRAAKEKKKQIRTQFFGDEAKESLKKKTKEKVAKVKAKIKTTLESLVGETITNQVKGLKSVVVDTIEDSDTIKELKTFIADIKTKGEELKDDTKEFIDEMEVELTAKAVELEQKGKEEVKKKEVKPTPDTKQDFATMSSNEFNKASVDVTEFMYTLTMDDIKAISKNPNISDAIKKAITIEYINLQAQEVREVKESGDKDSKKADTLLDDDIIKQINEEGC